MDGMVCLSCCWFTCELVDLSLTKISLIFFYKFLVSGRSGAIKSNELDLEYDLHSHVGRGV